MSFTNQYTDCKFTDRIGSVSVYTLNKGSTATISYQYSKFCLYGVKHPEVNNVFIKCCKIERKIQQHWRTLIERALIYE